MTINKNVTYQNYIYLYIFLLPYTHWGPQLGLLTGILFIWWFLRAKQEKYFEKLKDLFIFKATFFMILFLLFIILTFLWSDNIDEALLEFRYYKYYFFILPILFTSLKKEEVLISLKVLSFSFGIYGLFSFLIYLNVFNWEGSSPSNPKFLFRYMITGMYLVLGTILFYFFFFKEKMQIFKYILFLFFIISLIGVFINNGRAAQVSLIITTLFLFFINLKKIQENIKKSFFKSFFLNSIILFLIGLFIFNNNTLIKRYNKAYNQVLSYDSKYHYTSSSGYRIRMYEIGVDLFLENFLFGTGIGDFKDSFHNEIKNKEVRMTLYNTIHNVFLEYLVKYGIIGFSFFLLSLVYLLTAMKGSKYFNLALAIVTSLCISFLFDSILLYKPFNNVFILIFTLLGTLAYYEKKRVLTV